MLEKYSIIFSNLARPKNNRFSKQINRNERERRIELQNISPRCSRGRPSTRRRREAFWYLYHCFKLRYAQTYYYHNRQQHGIWAMVEGTRVEGERGLIAIMGPESARDRRNGKRLDSRRRVRTIERSLTLLHLGRECCNSNTIYPTGSYYNNERKENCEE